MRAGELGGQRGSQIIVDAVRIVDQRVGVAHDEFVTSGQLSLGRLTARAERRAARDARDGFLVEPLLLRTCEAKVLSNAAVDEIGVA